VTFKIAFRNILRNRRRSAMAILAIALGGAAIVLFGEYAGYVRAGLETSAVRNVGHLTVFREGYSDYGAGNPAGFAIEDYPRVIREIQAVPERASAIDIITPTISLTGIAGNFDVDASKTFLGTGFVPSDRDRMLRWDGYGIRRSRPGPATGLRDDDELRGVVGVGLARVLGLCQALNLSDCPPWPAPHGAAAPAGAALPADVAGLAARELPASRERAGAPRLDLLAASAGGAPNVVNLVVDRAEAQGARELDDSFVAMHLKLAQRLLFGGDDHKALAIVIQLHRTQDTRAVHGRLVGLFHA